MTTDDRVRRIQELRRSSAASPRPSGRRYRRKAKHRDEPDEPCETHGV